MIKQAIYKHFDDERLKKESKEKRVFSNFAPSYFNDCKRQVFYKKTNTPASNPNDTHSYIKFALGDATHEKIQSILKTIGIYQDGEDWKETEWNGLKWVYRYDGKLIVDGNQSIIEIKSSYGNGINYIERFGAKEEHKLQLYLYMLFENIDSGTLLYIGRDNGFILEFPFSKEELQKEFEEKINNKLEELKKLKADIENNNLPDKDFSIVIKHYKGLISFEFQKDSVKYKSDWHCEYCQWKSLCWQKELEEIKQNSFFINGEFIK